MHVGYRTSVDCQAKFFAFAGEITRIIVEAIKVPENIALSSSEISCEMLRNIPEFGPNFFTNFCVTVWENKERNFRIVFALILQIFDKDEWEGNLWITNSPYKPLGHLQCVPNTGRFFKTVASPLEKKFALYYVSEVQS